MLARGTATAAAAADPATITGMGDWDDEPPLDWETGAGPVAKDGRGTTLTVSQLASRIESLLAQGFPEPFWLAGEVSGLRRHANGHLFLKLVDGGAAEGRAAASVDAKMWRNTVQRLFGARGRLAGRLEVADGLVLRVRVRPDWYRPTGSLSFIVEDVDPEYTLGDLDRQRRELIARLEAEGAMVPNKAVPLPDVPLRLGLITAADSAAYNDVLHTLASSGIGFQVLCCDARMQGQQTSSAVRAALAALVARRPEAILLVRGGGSRIDLSWFDSEDIARAIAACPLPVLTGIGHEIDTSVADLVAHRAFKTPTAVAEHLVERARDARRTTEEAFAGLIRHVDQALLDERATLLDTARRLRSGAAATVAGGDSGLLATTQRLRAAAELALGQAGEQLIEQRSRLARGAHLERLASLSAQLDGDGLRLMAGARAVLDRRAAGLAAAADRARLLDPRGVLRRGFAWLQRADGSLLKDAAAARTGEGLVAVLRDGELDVRVESARHDAGPPGG
jgi:exodeoxyribonuclease VII large subunit